MEQKILDCGHKPSPHSDFTTGTGHTPDGREMCWDCCNKEERERMKNSDHYFAYVSGDGTEIQTWPGGHLAKITQSWYIRNNFAGKLLYVRAEMENGVKWYGKGRGKGWCIRLHRAKN